MKLGQLLLLIFTQAAITAQVTVFPGSPTQNPASLAISWTSPQVTELKLVIGRNTAAPCVISLRTVPTVSMFAALSDWYPSNSGTIGSGSISTSACTVNLAASSLSTSGTYAFVYSATISIQVSGALAQAPMDVNYLYTTYDNGGNLDQYERTDAIGTWNVTNAPAQPALLTSPPPGFVLPSPNGIFTWSPANFPAVYQVSLGSTQGSADIENSGNLTGTSWAFSPLPMGTTIHVTLATFPSGGGAPYYRYYSVMTLSPAAAAQITAPVSGTTLTTTGVTFQWSAAPGASIYKIQVGTRAGEGNLLDALMSTLSASTTIPLNGQSIYVTLTAYPLATSRSYVYRTASAPSPPAPASILTPVPGSVLPAGNVTFSWNAGVGVFSYRLTLGRGPESADIYSSPELGTTSAVVDGIPQTGITLYATLWSRIGNTLAKNSYMYVAPSLQSPQFPPGGPGSLISPVPGTQLSGPTATFQWSAGFGVSNYQLCAGSTPGSCNLHQSAVSPINTQTTFALPQDGSAVYASLWSQIGGSWYSSASTVSAVVQPCLGENCAFGPSYATFTTMPATFERRQFADGFLMGPRNPNDATQFLWQWQGYPFGYVILPPPAFPSELIIPRGTRYASWNALNPDDRAFADPGGSAVGGGAECFNGLLTASSPPASLVCAANSQNEPVVPVNGASSVRDPFMAIKTFLTAQPGDPAGSRRMRGFNVRAAFLDPPVNPLRDLPRHLIQTGPNAGLDRAVPDAFQLIQSIFFHHDPHYYGGSEYGYTRYGRQRALGIHASIDTNLNTNRGIGLGANMAFGQTSLEDDLNNPSRYYDYAAWVDQSLEGPMLCFQIGRKDVNNLISPFPVTTKWCKTKSQILAMEAGRDDTFTASDIDQMFVNLAKPGYVTATNYHAITGLAKDPLIPMIEWKKYFTPVHSIPVDFKLVVSEFLWVPQ